MAALNVYPSSNGESTNGGLVAHVVDGSPAARAGLRIGDVIESAADHTLRDEIDWRWLADEAAVEITARRDGQPIALELTRDQGEPWGLEFDDPLFDGVRRCQNACTFCFMTQLPPGMRPALYIRDDDYRLSFLQGNFVTLTNLEAADIERIAEQSLSPLYVSLHAVTPEVRSGLICARHDRALEYFDRLVEEGIDLHVQIVLVPGINDGPELDATLEWLAQREGVASVGIVPLGFTRHQDRFTASYDDPMAAATVIAQVQRWQFAMRERDGINWVHLADEFYLNARAPFPTTEFYDDFPQLENGIGLIRAFADEVAAVRDDMTRAVDALAADAESITVITGVMAATSMAGTLNAFDAVGKARLLVVPNSFFGGNVSVTGLLTGHDIIAALRHDLGCLRAPTAYLLPDVVFNADGVTLDDYSASDIARESGADVRVVSCDAAGLLSGLNDVVNHPPSHFEE